MLIWHKKFFFAKFEYGYQNNAEFYADFENFETNVKNLLTKKLQPKKVWKIRGSPLLYILLSCKSVWQITFSLFIFFDYFHRLEISVKFCEFWILICQKENQKFFWVIDYIYEYMLELVECKFARNGLTNWNTFLTNIFVNIIWHLFAGESHKVVKITVPYVSIILPQRVFLNPALQNKKFFSIFLRHFCPPGPGSGHGSADLIESGSKHRLFLHFYFFKVLSERYPFVFCPKLQREVKSTRSTVRTLVV